MARLAHHNGARLAVVGDLTLGNHVEHTFIPAPARRPAAEPAATPASAPPTPSLQLLVCHRRHFLPHIPHQRDPDLRWDQARTMRRYTAGLRSRTAAITAAPASPSPHRGRPGTPRPAGCASPWVVPARRYSPKSAKRIPPDAAIRAPFAPHAPADVPLGRRRAIIPPPRAKKKVAATQLAAHRWSAIRCCPEDVDSRPV